MKSFLSFAVLLLVSPFALHAADAPAGNDAGKPNILFFFADDQRADTIAALGNPVIQTPHLDRLVHRGTAFNRAYMQGHRGFTDGRWKLIRYPLVDRTQLFDLQADPQEVTNLAGKPEHASKIAELTAALEKKMQHSGDTNTLKVANPKPAVRSPPARGKGPAKQPE